MAGSNLRAAVVGSGPNGLTAAALLARRGFDVTVYEQSAQPGGGARSSELTGDGTIHDHCSAVHPLGALSPAFAELGLERHGLEWCQPPVDLAHPLEDGSAGIMLKDLAATCEALGEDGDAWERFVGTTTRRFAKILPEVMQPIAHLPRSPFTLAAFGMKAMQPPQWLADRFTTEQARGLFGGLCAHTYHRLDRPTAAAIALMLGAACHRAGWVVPKGGASAITNALLSVLREAGGRIETSHKIRSIAELGDVDAIVLNVTPSAAVALTGDRLPARVRKALSRWQHGPAAATLAFTVEGGVPWTNEHARQAGTVHVGGRFEDIVRAGSDVVAGKLPERPFVLVTQQYLADPTRSKGSLHPVDAYVHVPAGFAGDPTPIILEQMERYAPGLRERVISCVSHTTAQLELANPNLIGGDIVGGANTPRQILMRPRTTLDPYSLGIPGVYLASASTAPGAGVHGMAGAQVARRIFRNLNVKEPHDGISNP